MAIGVFGLQVAYRLKRLEVMSVDDTHGWFGGGQTTPGVTAFSTVDRIDFSNDNTTASIRGPLSATKYRLAATGNSNYGWFGGGYNPAGSPRETSTVDRIDFSNDSVTVSVRGPLSSTRRNLSTTGNSNYGWFGGGGQSGAPISTVDRIDFSNDSSTVSVRGPLSSAKYSPAATGNSNYGWFGGGSPGPLSTVDRIDFSNDAATASVRGPLSGTKYRLAATGNSNYGLFGGGASPAPAPQGGPIRTTVDRIDFSNDTGTSSLRGFLVQAVRGHSATGNSNYGWFGGGNSSTVVNGLGTFTIQNINFSNDLATASPRGGLSRDRCNLAAVSGQAKGPSIKLGKTLGYGWIGGNGYYVPPFTKSTFSTVDRIDFSNDSSTASPRGLLSSAKESLAAAGNSNYGWFGGGNFPNISTVDRIDFSNDSATVSVRGPLSLARANEAATGNSNYGWFGAGGSPSQTVDRIDFSNDSATASPRGNLIIATNQFGATGNSNYGWFGGGQAPGPPYIGYSYVQRIDFSNDLPTASPRGLLSASGYMLAATGNSNYGWFGSRSRDGGATAITTIDRINFSNDSVTASPRGLLNIGRRSASATGNSNYGWWFGGILNPGQLSAYSSVERIDFSNDSATASTRGNLTAIRNNSAATSNTPIG